MNQSQPNKLTRRQTTARTRNGGSKVALKYLSSFARRTEVFLGLAAFSMGLPGVNAQDVYHWPESGFSIPFDVSSYGKDVTDIFLEVSVDGGRTFQRAMRASSQEQEFEFDAPRDGLYQFRLVVLSRDGRILPNNDPPMSILVDTAKPTGNLTVDLDERGRLVASFAIQETNLAQNRVGVQYRLEDDNQWNDVPVELREGNSAFETIGNAVFQVPPSATRVLIRLRAFDEADNELEVIEFSEIPRTAYGSGGMKLASQSLGKAIFGGPDPSRGPQFPSHAIQPSILNSQKITNGSLENRTQQLEPRRNDRPYASEPFGGQPGYGSVSTDPPRAADGILNPAIGNPDLTSSAPGSSQPGIELFGSQTSLSPEPLEQRHNSNGYALESFRPEQFDNNRDANPNQVSSQLREVESSQEATTTPLNAFYSKSLRFELDYNLDVDARVPVREIQLYATVDRGASWEKWGIDPDRRSPFEIKVVEEGLFGFRMVVVNDKGHASNLPRNGAPADVWVLVDTTMPKAEIVSALYGTGQEQGQLIIEYRAEDENLADRPITLSFSETPEGPWESIESNLANQGRFAWETAPNLPRQVFLRLEVADQAGNISSYRLQQAVNVEGLTPNGRISGFRSVSP